MFSKFYPDKWVDSTYEIDFEKMYQSGVRGIIFDIDNTLVPHGFDADKRSVELMTRLKKIGFQICLLYNNKQERVERFNKDVNVLYIFDAHKPSKKNYQKAMELMKTDLETTVFIGDQLFTDVYGAKRTGLPNILVKPINPKEEIQIVLKRYLEKVVLYFYKRSIGG